jgi:hypothetical protein
VAESGNGAGASGAKRGDSLAAKDRAASSPGDAGSATRALVSQLEASFRDQVRRALGCELDRSSTSLAIVDHYLRLDVVRDETRAPILTLLAAGAGAYFGEVVREEIGGTWIGDGKDPRRLRFLLGPAMIHFAPVDLALDTILATAQEPASDDEAAAGLDSAFRLDTRPPQHPGGEPEKRLSDATWVEQRLSELPPIAVDQYHSLTARYETLTLILELLAVKHASEGREPASFGLQDYVGALVGER